MSIRQLSVFLENRPGKLYDLTALLAAHGIVSPGRAVISLCLTDAHRNAVGGVMGGVLLTMADFACAVASHFGTGAGQHVSADAHMSFLNPCRDDVLRAEAACLKPGKRLSWYEVLIRDGQDTLVAKATFTMCRVDPA